jgi:hypothetical protein
MPRIVYVVSNLQRAGPTFQLLNIVSHLDRSRFTPVVLTISPEPRESLKPSFSQIGVECHTLGLPGGARGGLRALSKARRAIGALKPDVVHSQGIRADLLAMFAHRHHTKLPATGLSCDLRTDEGAGDVVRTQADIEKRRHGGGGVGGRCAKPAARHTGHSGDPERRQHEALRAGGAPAKGVAARKA